MAVLNIQIVTPRFADIQGAIGAGIDDGGLALDLLLKKTPRSCDPAERLARAGVSVRSIS